MGTGLKSPELAWVIPRVKYIPMLMHIDQNMEATMATGRRQSGIRFG